MILEYGLLFNAIHDCGLPASIFWGHPHGLPKCVFKPLPRLSQ